MSIFNVAFTKIGHFFNKTPIFGLHLWIVILFFLLLIISFFLLVCSIRIASRRFHHPSKVLHLLKSPKLPNKSLAQEIVQKLGQQEPHREVQIQIGKEEYKVLLQSDRAQPSGESMAPLHQGWLRRYTLREVEAATNGLADAKVIGEGGYGIVYSGVLDDGTLVAVKNLSNNRGHAEKEFTVEIAVIGRVKHKNLVRLLGYCVEGDYRMLVYEYVDNGNLHQWLHRDAKVSPLTWNMRLNIILGTAKGLAYLHESLEPKVVHRDLKSCNILLDREWNPKVSDFGMAKLLSSDSSHVTTRVMGTFGYVAPEYASTGVLNEQSDVYSFGVLTMEIISGRSPIDYGRSEGEENLVEWMRTMIGNRRSEEVVDPKLPDAPPPKALKHILLVALLCVDPAASERPKMGQLIHMLEAVDLQVQHEPTHGDYKKRNLQIKGR